jgi:hypothetical protein
MKKKYKKPLELIILSIIAMLLCFVFTGNYIFGLKIVASIAITVAVTILVYVIAMTLKEYWDSIFKE